MMTVHITCSECGSGVNVYPNSKSTHAKCDVCQKETQVKFTPEHENSILKECPCCARKDFYKQKDFNRKIGVLLFIVAAILSIWTYGISFIVLYLADLWLFKKLGNVVVCYNCQCIFRQVKNIDDIHAFDHEMNDRIIYSGHDFQGKAP